MLNLIAPLMVLLSLIGGNNAQFGTCDYVQQMVPGKKYYVFNTNYPQDYPKGSTCRWIAQSDRPIKLTCNPFTLPPSDRCSQDALTILDAADTVGHRYCGNGTINLVSRSNKFTLTLTTSLSTSGGRFLCTLESAPIDDTDNCRCGWKNPSRIVGGEETGINEFPMMCGLIDSQLRILFCGATIINERQVITAAHCVFNRPVGEVGVLIGDHDISRVTETNVTKLLRVESFRIHPQYRSASEGYDIAIITVIGTITFSQQVGPVCLPFQHAPDTFGGTYIEVLGWGSKEFAGGPSSTLQKATLSVMPNYLCQRSYRELTSRQLCTQRDGKDSCQWDSGGPVLWQNPTSRRLIEVGIISYGSACADGEPSVNTRVGAYIDWILSVTPPGIGYCKAE